MGQQWGRPAQDLGFVGESRRPRSTRRSFRLVHLGLWKAKRMDSCQGREIAQQAVPKCPNGGTET